MTLLTAQQAIENTIDADAVAEMLGMKRDTVVRMAGERRLPGIKIGRTWRFRPSSLDAWLREREQSPKS